MTDLFQAAGLEPEAPRPLADRLRPQSLDEVVGQEHLVGPGAPLRRAPAQALGPRLQGTVEARRRPVKERRPGPSGAGGPSLPLKKWQM